MPDIYGNAWTVTIWIGESEDTDMAELAMDFIPSILNLKLLDRLTQREGCDEQALKSWVAFAKLLKRSWFSRRWVVQEVAFAKRASIRCASKIISWIDFADAIDHFMRKIELIRSLYDASEISKWDLEALSHVESAGSMTIVNATNSVFRKAEKRVIVDRPMDLESLVMSFKSLEASDPRDGIYAFLSLAKDTGKHTATTGETPTGEAAPPVPQYSKDPVEVYAEFIEYVVKTTGTLDIICRHWALPLPTKRWRPSSTVPSWIGLLKTPHMGYLPNLAVELMAIAWSEIRATKDTMLLEIKHHASCSERRDYIHRHHLALPKIGVKSTIQSAHCRA